MRDEEFKIIGIKLAIKFEHPKDEMNDIPEWIHQFFNKAHRELVNLRDTNKPGEIMRIEWETLHQGDVEEDYT